MRFLVLSALFVLSPCAPRGPTRDVRAQPAGSVVASAPRPTIAPAAPPAPPPDRPVVVVPRPLVTPITTDMATAMRAVVARNPATRADVFSKMGGSSVVNRGFLHCFAEEPTIDFRGRDFGDTLAHFRAGSLGRTTSFDRTSLAAEVGWSLRQALSGRRSAVVQEITATNARYALAFFGSNDVEGKNAHQFVGRLDRLVTTLEDAGVIPILGATYPRRANDREMNEQVRRYNRMSSALAQAFGLPYVDFHQAMLPLPGRALAADGYHPNSYVVGPRSRACDFGPEGMQFGNNHRNLLTMTVLDDLRRVLVAGEPAREPDAPVLGSGTVDDPSRVERLPFARRMTLDEVPGASIPLTSACGVEAGEGRTFAIRILVDRAMRIRASAVAMGPVETFLGIRRADGSCVAGGEHEQVVSLEPGVYTIVAFARASRRVAEDQLSLPPRVLVVVDQEP